MAEGARPASRGRARRRVPPAALAAGALVLGLAVLGAILLRCTEEGAKEGAESASFRDTAVERGLLRVFPAGSAGKLFIFENVGSGVGILDFDGDGRLDLFFASGTPVDGPRALPGPGPALYRQTPAGAFEEVAARSGIDFHGWGTGVAVGDLEGDGDPDLLLGTLERPLLFRNEGGRFRECGEEWGLAAPGFVSSAVFLDYDRDGLLDLYLARYVRFDHTRPPNGGRPCLEKGVEISCGPSMHEPLPHLLYRNTGTRFEDRTAAAGLGNQEGSYGLGAAAGDIDGDGWTDIYAANDTTANFLWRNQGDGTFREVALEAGCALGENGQGQSGMGVDLGDADGDGLPEVFVSNYAQEHNAYYANLGGLSFADRIHASGLTEGSYLPLGWGAKFLDYDQDGALDLVVVNGHVHPRAAELDPALRYEQPILAYRGDGRGRFRRSDGELGPDVAVPRSHRALAVGDLDRDGDLDLVVTVLDSRPVLLENRSAGGNRSLVLRLRGTRSNREGIGVRAVLTVGGRKQFREMTRGGGYLSASDAALHFGLGALAQAEVLELAWPSGTVDRLGPLPAGIYLIQEGGKVIEGRPLR